MAIHSFDNQGTPPRDTGAFPGGRTRLPRINRPAGHARGDETITSSGRATTLLEPEVLVDASGFTATVTAESGTNTHRIASPGDDTEFGQYYSAESLFNGSRETDVTSTISDGPYAVLGLTRQASWEQIRRAHRALVSSLHPDRFVGEDPTVIEHAEQRVRDVNEAFAEIRRQRSGNRF